MGLRHPASKSFIYAFSGIKAAFKQEPNLRIHIILAITAAILGIILGLSATEWLILILTIFFVITLEFFNTALEATVNLVSPEIKEKARIAKDVSAACVLLVSVMAIIVGVVLFVPKILFLFFPF
jgi:diacylglycerol kinase